MQRKDVSGKRFNSLTAIKFIRSYRGKTFWRFKCDCGSEFDYKLPNVELGRKKMCRNCFLKWRAEETRKMNTTHGMSKTVEFTTWVGIIQRCTNSNNKDYKNYGGRGIKVCPEWMKFENFYLDMRERPEGHSIDRINVDKNYCKENCRWTNRFNQQNNKRNNIIVVYNKVKYTVAVLAKKLKISVHLLRSRALKTKKTGDVNPYVYKE